MDLFSYGKCRLAEFRSGRKGSFPPFIKIALVMKLMIALLCITFVQLSAESTGQTITLRAENASLDDILKEIQKQSGYSFFYSQEDLKHLEGVNIDVDAVPVRDVLERCLEHTPLSYIFAEDERAVILKRKPSRTVRLPGLQPVIVSGVVSDTAGVSLPGVSVVLKDNASTGTSTDAEGRYSLEIPEAAIRNGVLVVSFIGYLTREIPLDGKAEINITLRQDVVGLDQIVVVGYGTREKTKVTSAISEINASGLKDLPAPTSGQLLLGRASGVSVHENSGAPGSPPSIQIHGISSINAGIEPLVVIDGFPVGNGIPQSLNPNDIEKITVLKDAASTSIYGARGTNGVILIQTTNPKESEATIEYNTYGGMQYVPQNWRPDVLNALQYAQYNKERVDEINAANNTNTPVPEVFQDVLDNPGKYGEGTDWFDAFIREGSDAWFQNHNLTFRAGNQRFRGVVSGGYLDQEGVLPNSDFKRYSLRTNVEGEFTDWFNATANVSVARTENNTLPVTDMWGIVMQAVVASPLQSPYDENGELVPYLPADVPGYFSFPNPLFRANVTKDNAIGSDLNAGLSADIQIIEGLHYKPQVYTRLFTQEENTFIPTTLGKPQLGSAANLAPGAPPFVNSASNRKFDVTNWGMDNLLTFDKQAGGHSFSAMVGYTVQEQTGELSQINASDFPTDDHINYLEASEVSAAVSDYTNWSLSAFFGRVNYDYKGKYIAEINFRREGSSKFGDNNKYGNFPSASVGWRISQENFYPRDFFINEVKIRGSYGKTGNSAIGDYDRFGTVVSIPNLANRDNNYNYALNNSVIVGKALTSLGNQDLKWETSRQLDIGLTLGLLNDQITFKADYYRKVTEDMLFNISLPLASGFSSTRVNVGQMLNHGWDFEVGSRLHAKEFAWNSHLNVSLLRNEVTYIPDQITKIISTYNITQEGAPVGSLYGYMLDGIFNTREQLDDPALFGWPGAKKLGAFIYRDVNGDGKIDPQDQTIIGNPHPRVILGFNNSFTYKNLSLSILATGAFGYEIVSEINEWLYNEKGRWNVSTKFLNRWRSPEDPGEGIVPAIHYPGQHNHSNDWVEKGDHIWIKNITLGYTLPRSLLKMTNYVSNLRFYLSVQNAFRFTQYSGWNPQVSTRGGNNPQTLGIDNFSYPIARTYTLGAAINF